MPGPAFNIQIVKRLRQKLQNDSAAKDIDQRPSYAYLGAMGFDIFQYLPVTQQVLDELVAKQKINLLGSPSQREIAARPLGATYAVLCRWLLYLFDCLDNIHRLLTKFDKVAADEDTDGLAKLDQEYENVSSWYWPVLGEIGMFANLVYEIGRFAAAQRPSIQQDDHWWETEGQRPQEYLRWHRTGKFARALFARARSEEAEQLFPGSHDALLAYTWGFLAHIAGSATGEPFIGNIVGGPYRTHWWRSRYVRNYVDVWTWGRYETPDAGMDGDEPLPKPQPFTHSGYRGWADLMAADLPGKELSFQGISGRKAAEWLAKGIPANLPDGMPPDLDAVAWLLWKTVDEVYGDQKRPPDLVDEKSFTVAFKEAFVGTYGVLWLMTGAARWLKPPELGPAPCQYPAWMLQGEAPPSPQPQTNPEKVLSASILAILAAALFGAGQATLGWGAVGLALKAAKESQRVDWSAFRCTLYWIRYNLYEVQRSLQDGLAKSGLGYPLAARLGTFLGPPDHTVPASDTNGIPLCKSGPRERYPRQMWAQPSQWWALNPDQSFDAFPASPQELGLDVARVNPLEGCYPDRILDGWSGPTASVFEDTSFPSEGEFFGDAVAVVLELIANGGEKLLQKGMPDYNLDGDRGYGWKTWTPGEQPAFKPASGHLQEQKED